MNIAFFDFDGTISFKDSFFGLLHFGSTKAAFYLKAFWLLPVLLGYKSGLIPNYKAKQIVIKSFFGNMNKDNFSLLCNEYSKTLDNILRPLALKRLKWHKENGDKIVIVTASIEEYLKPWCDENGFELIASKLEVQNGRITGQLLGTNCHGDEKVRQIKEKYDLSTFEKIYAYGDTKGDLPMLALANESFYKPFRD